MGATYQRDEIVQVRSTWPDGIFPGENCLPYDGSKVPDCSEYIDPNHYIPYYHEHSQSKKSGHLKYIIAYPTQTAAVSGSVVRLTRLASLNALPVLASVLVDLDRTTATSSARVNRDTSGQTPSTTSEPSIDAFLKKKS